MKQYYIYIAIALVLVGFVWYKKEDIKKVLDFGNDKNLSDTNINVPKLNESGLDLEKILQSGTGTSTNPSKEVQQLQYLLNSLGARLDDDGVFGQLTLYALAKYTNGAFTSISLSKAYTILKTNLVKI
jgi:hypothetical protein